MNLKDIDISKVTLGTVQLGLRYGMANRTGKPSAESAREIIENALDGGIFCFDTSREYGDSEEVLGSYFSVPSNNIKRHSFVTKFKLDRLSDNEGSLVEKTIYGYAYESMKRLGINKIPVYMLHNAADMARFGDLTAKTLMKMKKEDLIGCAGVSVYHVAEALEMIRSDAYEAIQLPMNILDQRFITSGMLDKLHKRNTIVFVRSVFLQGMFLMDPASIPENLLFAAKYINDLRKLADEENISVSTLAFSFIRDLEGVSSIVLGAETPQQVRENAELVKCAVLSLKIRNRIEDMFSDVPIENIMIEIRKVKYT